VRQQLKALLEAATAQQAESSASRQCSERGRAGAPSAHGPNPPPSQHRECGEGGGAAASVVRSRLGRNRDVRNTIKARRWPRASTTTMTTARTTTTIEDAGDITTATTTATAAGHETRGVRGPLARASVMRSSPRASELQPTFRYDGDTNPSGWLED
jgi:hypothetical protein